MVEILEHFMGIALVCDLRLNTKRFLLRHVVQGIQLSLQLIVSPGEAVTETIELAFARPHSVRFSRIESKLFEILCVFHSSNCPLGSSSPKMRAAIVVGLQVCLIYDLNTQTFRPVLSRKEHFLR